MRCLRLPCSVLVLCCRADLTPRDPARFGSPGKAHYKFPPVALSSITNRVTGCVLSGGAFPRPASARLPLLQTTRLHFPPAGPTRASGRLSARFALQSARSAGNRSHVTLFRARPRAPRLDAAVMFGGLYPLVGDLPAFIEAFKATAPFLVRPRTPTWAPEPRVRSASAASCERASSLPHFLPGVPGQARALLPADLPLPRRRQTHRAARQTRPGGSLCAKTNTPTQPR